ncbi:putative receptor protein kinase ZmPK1 [Cinnamomum micranthum f. kanehirae]|uniref:Receptor-like serine/threonine-protein kinase n=1 Tax=Cinnamomum micranthum f. kanehirae TaxID=337451 RepID=A0A3S3QJN6_9MAGN|nr:putative receptor protein kinase ZmPK1 [Cinnamomum micranthum f. kanehirae]
MRRPSTLLLLSLFFSCIHSCFSLSSLYKGSSLSVEDESDHLISSDSSFTCGFYKVGTNAYSFSIWVTNSIDKTIVWTANRDRPVNGRKSRMWLHPDGTMVIKDADDSTIWSANTSTPEVDRAELLNSGNLVLKNPSGRILWQSFDFPTDTLLPLQLITKGKSLLSSSGRGDSSSGFFVLHFDSDNVLRMMYDGPEISSVYWPNPDFDLWGNLRTSFNSSRLAVLDETGLFSSSDKFNFTASDMGLGIIRRLTLDFDGNLRLYSLNESTGLWGISWAAFAQECNVHGICGRYGVCVYTPKPMCSCPPGYEVSDPADWNKGCKPKFKTSCDSQQFRFVALPYTDYYGFDLNYSTGISLEECRNICLKDCSCRAFQYRVGLCYAKGALFNGRRTPNFPGTIYLKLPKSLEVQEPSELNKSEPICNSSQGEVVIGSSEMFTNGGSKEYTHFFWFALGVGVVEILFIATGWWSLFRKQGMPKEGYQAISDQFRRFTYAELKKATRNFKEELGRGASGAVYKGVLGDKRAVGVKKLWNVIQGEEEFWAEVSTIGRINHMNVVRMWGYCAEVKHRLLVSEYIEGGSLDNHLFSSGGTNPANALGWNERFKIAVGMAKGLAYLHHECLEWVVHCDVKPENILLDKDFEPKIADFGLAKLSERGMLGSNFSRIRGTKGYIAPEWTLNLPITAKVDVYSYGVVLLELVKGSRFSNWVGDGEEEVGLRSFLSAVKEKMGGRDDLWVGDFVDFRLGGQFNWKQVTTMVEIGVSCLEDDRNSRPSMSVIAQTLLACE